MLSFYDLVQNLLVESTSTSDFDPFVYPHFIATTRERALEWKSKYEENNKWVIPVFKENIIVGRTDRDLKRWLARKSGPNVAYLFGIHFNTQDTLNNLYFILWKNIVPLANTHNVHHNNKASKEKDEGAIVGLASHLFYLITKAFHRPHDEWRYYFGKYYSQEYQSFIDSLRLLAEKIIYGEPNDLYKHAIASHLKEVIINFGSMDLFYVQTARRYL